jgi:hypothetical protein
MGSGDTKRVRLAETIYGIPLHDHLYPIGESPELAAEQGGCMLTSGTTGQRYR